ncbi:uncharacterized protein LOC129222563 [Uloborus diversus]|uniref:uncharacterized protein LOC129222563 n=1 Tax=Uloborus diversus TaxID=327109 RepID=UPI002409FD8B|nr:uncharacterized protein LOC129222563 [Uloborus diversus]
MRLPKIELSHFSGDLKDYLGFWSQFQRIHSDSELAEEDKFQYLLQCISPGSRAREVIESFPPTVENYGKAIDALKSRFGREELLIEYYVRELLYLVVKNATEKRRNFDVAKLYDKLESHLRSLESLGLTSEKYESIMFPLVESCIPEDVLRVLLRNPTQAYEENEASGSYGSKLRNLLSFLKREVEGEERLQLARNGFDGTRERWKLKKAQNDEEVIPTASTLVSSDQSKRQSSWDKCVFCDKIHESRDCYLAQSWSLDKKKKAVGNKKACYVCFKANHRAKECKSKVKCMMCSKRHHTIMCFELPVNKREETASEPIIDTSKVLVAKEGNEVLLQNTLVNIEANGKRKLVRALLDSGSQNSHILKITVVEMGLKPMARRNLAHSVFGGGTTSVKDHGRYKITLKPLNGTFYLDIQVLDQQTICGEVPRLKRGPWDVELSKKKIWITDSGKGLPDIELLIGADFCGELFTGKMEHLQCGLIACETHLGLASNGKGSWIYF